MEPRRPGRPRPLRRLHPRGRRAARPRGDRHRGRNRRRAAAEPRPAGRGHAARPRRRRPGGDRRRPPPRHRGRRGEEHVRRARPTAAGGSPRGCSTSCTRSPASTAARAARLDTSSYLTAAVALYRSAGYTEVADYNGNVKADLWFERSLDATDDPDRAVRPRLAGRPSRASGPRSRRRSATGRSAASTTSAAPRCPGSPPSRSSTSWSGSRTSRARGPASSPSPGSNTSTRPTSPSRCTGSASRTRTGAPTTSTSPRPAARRFADELAFRDRLRADPATAEAYEALKRDLAARFPDDRDAYTEAKTAFIRATLRGRSALSLR